MKFLVVLALAALAVAEPEADPQTIVYQPYTVPQTVVAPTARIAVTPTMYYSSPKYYTNPMYYINPMYYTNPVYANAASFYSPRMVYQYNNPLVYTSPVVRADEPVVVPEADKPADDDDEKKPDVAVDTNTQTKPLTPVVIPTPNSLAYAPSIYTVPHTYAYTNPIVAPVAYKATPSYYASSAPGVVHQVAKREAEPDSDAQFFYSNYYGYPAYNNYAYNAYPYRYAAYAAPYAYGYRYL